MRAHRSLRLNVGLVLGDDACLVVDTRSTENEALELIGAVRTVTRLPWVVVNTHAHFDHCFGNAPFRPAKIWGHPGCATDLATRGEIQRREAVAFYRSSGLVDLADGIETAIIDPPDQFVRGATSILLGGRSVELTHLGRGHTDHDVVAGVADAQVVFAGDLVEEGDPPAFEDSFPLDWGGTLGRLAPSCTGPVVPGHGSVVNGDFVADMAAGLERAAAAARTGWENGRSPNEVWKTLAYPEAAARLAIARTWAQLRASAPSD